MAAALEPPAQPISPSGRYRLAVVAGVIAAAAAATGTTVAANPADRLASAAAVLGVFAMLIGGYAVSRRPKDSLTLLAAALTSLLAGVATNPAWDSIRLMQWVMAATAGAAALIVLLPPTGQRVAFSLLVFYHFAGIVSAITSPPPMPWMTGQLWARIFRPHLEFSYVNNAYQFYSPQPGPAQLLWFCITGADGQSRWYKTPIKGDLLDPLGIEYFRRLSLTERAHQLSGTPPSEDVRLARQTIGQDIPLHPGIEEIFQYQCPTEQGRHFIEGYARHVGRVLGTGRKYTDGTPVPVYDIKVYLTQHDMLNQIQFQKSEDPYGPETYKPVFYGMFDGEGRPKMNQADRAMLYWLVPIYKTVAGQLKNFVIFHAGSNPFDPELAWRIDPTPVVKEGKP